MAELNFGFWTSLLSGSDEAALWRPNKARLLKHSFPAIPRPLRQRNTIYYRYNHLRDLRNRVFHHEPVWNRPTLVGDHQKILEAVGWISPQMGAALQLVDRFPVVYQHEKKKIETMLKTHLRISE